MPSTWAGTANNGLVTFKALNDAWGTIFVPVTSAPTGTDEIVTKADVETYIRIDTGNTIWTAISSNQCPTKEEIYKCAIYDALFYANIVSGNAGYDITFTHKRAGSTVQTKSATINTTTCGSLDAKVEFINTSGTNALKYNDTLELSIYYSGTGTAIELKVANSGYSCGTENSSTCGATYTVNTRIRRSYQPKSYSACV